MVERDLGEATILYEKADGDTVEKTVENEHIAYFQDHWILRTGEDERGRDVVRRIPLQRVYHVERSVEEFEEEVKTLRDQVQGLADGIRTKLLGGGDDDRGGGGRYGGGSGGSGGDGGAVSIDVERGDGGGDDRDR